MTILYNSNFLGMKHISHINNENILHLMLCTYRHSLKPYHSEGLLYAYDVRL